MTSVRVRFAPSPTGALHLGGATAGVANFLFARRAGGTFVLRIDDTDQTRSRRSLDSVIRQDAEWLGLRFDEGPTEGGPYGPYRQSERQPIYREQAERLLQAGLAYRWFGGEDDGDAPGEAPEPDEAERRVRAGEPAALRFRVPERDVVLEDAARGDVTVPAGALKDFVLLRSDGTATYSLATAVDDALMEISHVIRGEDHLVNTARQILVIEALGFKPPRYAHTALIVGADGTKLSKRDDAPSIAELRAEGYPPEALLNYLAQLACPSVGDEPMLLGALAARFELSHASRGTTHFDLGRLDWLSQQHLKRLNGLELARRVGTVLELRGVQAHPSQLLALGEAFRGCYTLVEAADEAEAVLVPVRSRPPLSELDAKAARIFHELRSAWPAPFLGAAEADELMGEIIERGQAEGLSKREVLHGIRLALTGRERGVPLTGVIGAIEREDALERTAARDGEGAAA